MVEANTVSIDPLLGRVRTRWFGAPNNYTLKSTKIQGRSETGLLFSNNALRCPEDFLYQPLLDRSSVCPQSFRCVCSPILLMS